MYHQRSLGFIPLCTLALGVTISAFRRRAVFMLAGFLAYELAIVFNVNRFLFRILVHYFGNCPLGPGDQFGICCGYYSAGDFIARYLS
jgi:hypothetical protein